MRVYRRLTDYISEHGDARVLAAYHTPDGFALGRWVSSQRKSFAAGTLMRSGRSGCESFLAGPGKPARTHGMCVSRSLNDYVIQYGHADVPSDYSTPEGFYSGALGD